MDTGEEEAVGGKSPHFSYANKSSSACGTFLQVSAGHPMRFVLLINQDTSPLQDLNGMDAEMKYIHLRLSLISFILILLISHYTRNHTKLSNGIK